MAEVKKVAFVHGEFPIGGAERVTCDIATALLERGGYEVYVFVVSTILNCCRQILLLTVVFM